MGLRRQLKLVLLFGLSAILIIGFYNIPDTSNPFQGLSALDGKANSALNFDDEEKAKIENGALSVHSKVQNISLLAEFEKTHYHEQYQNRERTTDDTEGVGNEIISENDDPLFVNLTQDKRLEKVLENIPRDLGNVRLTISDPDGNVIKDNIHPVDIETIRRRRMKQVHDAAMSKRAKYMMNLNRHVGDRTPLFREHFPPQGTGGKFSNNSISLNLEDEKWDRYFRKVVSRGTQKAINWDTRWLSQFAKKSLFNLIDISYVGKGIYPHRINSFTQGFSLNGSDFKVLLQRITQELRSHDLAQPDTVVTFNKDDLPKELYNLAPTIFDKMPRDFLPGFKSSCWINNDPAYATTPMMCLPYFYIIGAPKCATTDLWAKINLHPDVVPTKFKEPQFWTRGNLEIGFMKYVHHFHPLVDNIRLSGGSAKERLVVSDATASHFWERRRSIMLYGERPNGPPYFTADIFRAVQPNVKLIVIVRDPGPRLYSEYLDLDTFWPLYKSPEDFHTRVENVIRYFNECMAENHIGACASAYYQPRIQVGMYSFHIREWLRRFPREQLFVLRTEEWAYYPTEKLKQIFEFLKLGPVSEVVLRSIGNIRRHNVRKKKNRVVGAMLPETKAMLEAFYRPFNEDLAQLMDDPGYKWNT